MNEDQMSEVFYEDADELLVAENDGTGMWHVVVDGEASIIWVY